MAWFRKDTRRTDRRALRPTIDGRLETRVLMTVFAAAQTAAHSTSHAPVPNQILTANGGRKVRIGFTNGEYFDATISNGGTIRARRLPGGRIGLVVFGSTVESELEIEPKAKPARKGLAHDFAPNYGDFTHIINIGSIVVKSGKIHGIFGYRTAVLSGPVTIMNDANNPIDRIAFYQLLPGASITTGSDLDTLDVFNDTNLSGAGTGLNIGRDLNWFFTAGNVSISNGATITVGRDIGLAGQPAKGTDPGGQGVLIEGNVAIDPSSSLVIKRNLAATFEVQGNFSGESHVTLVGTVTGGQGIIVLGNQTP